MRGDDVKDVGEGEEQAVEAAFGGLAKEGFRRRAFNLAKKFSMGLRSGE